MEESDTKDVASLIAKCFAKSNPINVHIGFPEDEMFRYTEAVVKYIVNQNLSIVIDDQSDKDGWKETERKNIVGACVVFDMKTDFEDCNIEMTSNLNTVYEYLDTVDKVAFASSFRDNGRNEFEIGECAFLSLVAIDSSYSGRGLFRQMVTKLIDVATEKRMKFLYTQAANPGTTKGMMRIGYHNGREYEGRILANVPFNSFITVDGRQVFDGMDGGTDAIIVNLL